MSNALIDGNAHILLNNMSVKKERRNFDKVLKPITPFDDYTYMPTYLDVHGLGNVTREQIKQAQNAPKDEFGVTHKNMLYNIEENKFYCIFGRT